MKVENQIKNDKYNIFYFLTYLSNLQTEKDMIAFIDKSYGASEINAILQKSIEYHSMFENFKFDLWLLKNKKRIKNSIIFVRIDKLNAITKRHLKALRKYGKEIVVEFGENISIKEVKKYAKGIDENIITGYLNNNTKELRKTFMLLGKDFEYKKIEEKQKVLAIIHVFNEEDVVEKTIEYLLKQEIDIYLLDNWSTDNTYKIIKKMQSKYPERIKISRYPDNEPTEKFYDWTNQLHKTEQIARELDYDWYIHYDTDEIRITPYDTNVTLVDMITFVDSIGYNAINTTVLDFRMTDKNDDIFNCDTYFEIGRKPSHFMQVKTWKKCNDIDLASTGGHLAKFENQKIYPIKMINKHYPLRNLKQAEKKIYQDRLPRFEKEKQLKGWHSQYDKIAETKDFIYEKENLNQYGKDTLENLRLELISGVGIDKL